MANDILHLLSQHLKQTIVRMVRMATEHGSESISPVYLWYALSLEKGSVASEILRKAGFNAQQLLPALRMENAPRAPSAFLRVRHKKKQQQTRISDEVASVLAKSFAIAAEFSHTYVGTEHVILALAENQNPLNKQIIKEHHINANSIAQYAENVLVSNTKFPEIASLIVPSQHEDAQKASTIKTKEKDAVKSTAKKKTPALDYFTVDLSSSRAQKTIDPVIGREQEIDRITTILCRRTKNNPVLLGDPGVGKTAIVEGLAKKISQGKVPAELHDKRILSLDMGLLIAGSTYRGEFEARLKQVVDEIKNDPNIIIFIDELHTIVGAGANAGTLDAANMLKPALARGELRCIGATTSEEYKKHIESDSALERRFQPIVVSEPSAAETIKILKGIAPLYESFHGVRLPEMTLNAAVELADRFLTDKFFPDKAIDLIDEAATKKHLSKTPHPVFSRIKKVDEELEHTRELKQRAIEHELFKEALEIKASEIALERIREELEELARVGTACKTKYTVTPNDVAEVVSHISGLPIARAEARELSFQKRRDALKKHIIGQDSAIDAILTALESARLGINSPNRPIASFILAGPSGVGKTELAKRLAETVFQDRQAFIRIDMSEFAEGFHVSKLIGSPAGYIGYKESNPFTDRIKRHPHSVILFDEIDKAHHDVFNLLLQILDEGFLTDSVGKKINFRNTIILMTTTVGAEHFAAPKLGFQTVARVLPSFEQIRKSVINDIKTRFRSEFLNRVNDVLIMRPLNAHDIEDIVQLELEDVRARFKQSGTPLDIAHSVAAELARDAQMRDQGARAVRKVAEERIVTPLVRILSEHKKITAITVGLNKNEITFQI